jgi:signal transduction histidine kinase
MKMDFPVPYEKLDFFEEQLRLEDDEQQKLAQYQQAFLAQKKEFAEYFYAYFHGIPETRIVLEHERQPGHLKVIWAQWFESLFKQNEPQEFFTYLWKSGLRHVEVNTDQSFVNLGYSMVRRFCRGIASMKIPLSHREPVLVAVDKRIDLCLLVETQAFLTATSHCDIEVVKGICHQVRNPITIIGGNIHRLQKEIGPESPLYKTYEIMLHENKRIESMVCDIGIYSEMFEKRSQVTNNSLQALISRALERLREDQPLEGVKIDIDLDPRFPEVQGDSKDLETMLFYLFQNSVEAVDSMNPYIRISLKGGEPSVPFVDLEIFNTGTPPKPEELDNLFVPFFSSKPYGTGFGLPIAQLTARKNFGDITLQAVPGHGTKCIVRLPIRTDEG